ncbi:protein DpdE [Rheinheimera sp. UJ63]|uniref:protein DpdE n=1 Tax=Rheinheimera sp. UJ63 TaxID=2910157 RepID=UPI001F37ADA8|nr:protein DpdE [Rheinheimera sp. UJ63]MCF4010637.1 SNF2-related protein [Rheinheimera sp. UJ63]
MRLVVGSLVEGAPFFKGIGKILSTSAADQSATVGFFTSPINPYDKKIKVKGSDLIGKKKLFEKTVVYVKFGSTQRWRMGFYDGERPGDKHLIYFNHDESDIYEIEELFVPNLLALSSFPAAKFLASQATSAFKHYENRTNFITSYIEQRAACNSISSLSSSAVNLEIHQLSVVLQVLKDSNQKYLLGDEVGLGKTIEAGFLIREHILELKDDACVLVIVPTALINQWKQELTLKFHLEDVLGIEFEEDQKVFVCDYFNLPLFDTTEKKPTMVVIDEGHNLANLAWNDDNNTNYQKIVSFCSDARSTIILSGTPIAGNAKSFLAMLHCLSPDNYKISEEGIVDFNKKVSERELFSGIYTALSPESDDFTLSGILDELETLDLGDFELSKLIENLKPEIDFFNINKNDVKRNCAIYELKQYFGERYRLFQRFIRNRRGSKNSSIELLFPGLGNCELQKWGSAKQLPYLDQQLDDYRDYLVSEGQEHKLPSVMPLLDALLDSPSCLSSELDRLINIDDYHEFFEIFSILKESALCEQKNKDELTKSILDEWLKNNTDGKVAIFCGNKAAADCLYSFLMKHRDDIERHSSHTTPLFVTNPSIKVLIIDEKGEDGLNLQGPSRLAIHYSLPRSLVRIEQRIGRLNRYSATSKGMKPIENYVLIPGSDSFIQNWALFLKDIIGVFNETTASIQLALEDVIQREEQNLLTNGFRQLSKIRKNLSGEKGIIAKERKKVADQEVWNEMQVDLTKIKKFAEQMQKIDSDAESLHNSLQNWIRQSLKFRVTPKDESTFVYQYKLGITRLNIDDFLHHCILGIDFNSGLRNPATKPMTPNREITAKTGAYPLRYGQPFIDTIYNFTQGSILGLVSSVLRLIKIKLEKPKTFLKLNWLVSCESSEDSVVEQRNLDEEFEPHIKTEWIDDSGNIVENEAILNLLRKPVQVSKGEHDNSYRDFEVLVTAKQDLWELFNSFCLRDEWERVIEGAITHRESQIIKSVLPKNEQLDLTNKLTVRLVSALSMTLVGGL